MTITRKLNRLARMTTPNILRRRAIAITVAAIISSRAVLMIVVLIADSARLQPAVGGVGIHLDQSAVLAGAGNRTDPWSIDMVLQDPGRSGVVLCGDLRLWLITMGVNAGAILH